MPPTPETPGSSSIEQAAAQHAQQILARRAEARKTREAALAEHPRRIAIQTQIKFERATEAAVSPTAAAATEEAVTVTRSLTTAGYLIAIGDSWFDYPIRDVLTNLDDHFGYSIESCAHKGDPIEAMVSPVGQLDRFARLLDKVTSFGAEPRAILISGGGDDIAGAEFGMLINELGTPIAGWNEQIVAGVIDTRIAEAYRLMFSTVNAICEQLLHKTFPIVVHGYDHPVPDGRGFLGGWGPLPGPWLKPGFDEKRFAYSNPGGTTQMMAMLIDRFNTMLQNLLPAYPNVRYVDLRGTLSTSPGNYQDDWANELHPTGGDPLSPGQNGFYRIAKRMNDVI